jgi:hypothetical protein
VEHRILIAVEGVEVDAVLAEAELQIGGRREEEGLAVEEVYIFQTGVI